MKKILDELPQQLLFTPDILDAAHLKPAGLFVVGGMGGSHLPASLIKDCHLMSNLIIHSDYGLPPLPAGHAKEALFIAVSHSGDTEETIDFARTALAAGYAVAVITTGGALARWAEEHALPRIIVPTGGDLPPRLATGYLAVALYAIMGMHTELTALRDIVPALTATSETLQTEAQALMDTVGERIPLIHACSTDLALAYYLKIGMNETAKRPAFCNVYPELNHNEMAGFSVDGSATPFCIISIHDPDDHPRVEKRMMLTKKILAGKGAVAADIRLTGESRLERFWRFVMLASRASFISAATRDVDPEDTSLIESFKKDLA